MLRIWFLLLSALAMTAFAANSLLNRVALADGEMGAWTFTLVRIGAAALVLAALANRKAWREGSWFGGLAFVGYAGMFSYAYLQLDAGIGALVLFATVQFTMVGWGLFKGEILSALQWAGLILALVALAVLVWPVGGVRDVAPLPVFMMVLAGVGWGSYSLLGRGTINPLAVTSGNFLRAGVIAAAISPVLLNYVPETRPSDDGLLAAMISGGVTTALGCTIWYKVMPKLTTAQAGVMQLSAPAIAAVGGVALLAEPLTLRFAAASFAILVGVAMVLFLKRSQTQSLASGAQSETAQASS